VSLLDISGEDEDTWRDDSEVLIGTHLDVFGEESSKEIEVASLEEPVEHQEPEPVLLHQSGRAARTKARRTYT